MTEELAALYTGVIKLDEFEIPCYVLNDETRVLSQREVVKLITGGRDSGNLFQYLNSRALQPYLPAKFTTESERNPLVFRVGTAFAHAIRASDVVDICNSYLKATQAGVLHPNQAKLAEQSEMFIAACAKTGIEAIVDEATGYQYYRQAMSLQQKFSMHLQEEYRQWTETFPLQFFLQLYRLEGITPPQPVQPYPKRFGKYIMQFVYDTLDKDIADYLRENNPNPGGKKHHHQLFNDFGYKNLQDHLMAVLGIMKASIKMERFKESLDFAFPNNKANTKKRLATAKREKLTEAGQLDLEFDYIATVDTQDKDITSENNKNTTDEFSNVLSGLLKVPPPKNDKKPKK